MHTPTCKYVYYNCNIGSTLVLASCYLCIRALYMQNYYKKKNMSLLASVGRDVLNVRNSLNCYLQGKGGVHNEINQPPDFKQLTPGA